MAPKPNSWDFLNFYGKYKARCILRFPFLGYLTVGIPFLVTLLFIKERFLCGYLSGRNLQLRPSLSDILLRGLFPLITLAIFISVIFYTYLITVAFFHYSDHINLLYNGFLLSHCQVKIYHNSWDWFLVLLFGHFFTCPFQPIHPLHVGC